MKKTILFLVVVALLSACSEKKITVSITGTSEKTDMNGKELIMEYIMDGNLMASDTLMVVENKLDEKLKLDSASIRTVYTKDRDIEPFEVYLEEGTINIHIDSTGYATVSGTPMNDLLQTCYEENAKFVKSMEAVKALKDKEEAETGLTSEKRVEYFQRFDSLVNIKNDRVIAFVKENINNPVGKYYFFKSYFFLPIDKKDEMMSFATDDIKAAYNK